MNEIAKTLSFVAAAVLVLAAAAFVNSRTNLPDAKEQVGQYLNDDVEVGAPKRLRIVKFDRETAAVREFEVAEVDGVWSIPSKQDYPADATRQMAEAATGVIDRRILRVAAESADAHEELGVIDPLSANLDSKSTGVGTRVIMTDGNDDELVDMIIGKPVKDAEGQRYVRRSNYQVVYVVELDSSSLSTDFAKWIESDLLKLNPFDITRLFVNDYSADLGFMLTPQGVQSRVSWDRRGEITLAYDNAASKWNLVDLKKYDRDQKKFIEEKLADDEEVNQDSLGKLRTGLDDLLIVDVAKKPEGLSADLKAGEDFLKNEEAFEDLIEKGFSPVAISGNEPEILSSEGEIVCTLRDGVEYVLRFGQLQVQTESAAADGEEAAAKAEQGKAAQTGAPPAGLEAGKAPDEKAAGDKKEGDGGNLRRYLFVMARFNEDSVEKPKLKDLPPLPEEGKAKADDGKADDGKADDGKAAETGKEDEEEPTTDADGKAKEDAGDEDTADAEGEKGTDDDTANDDKSAEAKKVAAERKAIELENKRLEDEYKETLDRGKKTVEDLNRRFGDWYYVISNDVYKQIHLGRSDVIKKKEKAADKDKAAAGAGAEENPLSGLPQLPGREVAEEESQQNAPAEQPATEDEGKAQESTEDAPAAEAESPAEDEPAAEAPPADPQ